MDPEETLILLILALAAHMRQEAQEHADALADWLSKDGFCPTIDERFLSKLQYRLSSVQTERVSRRVRAGVELEFAIATKVHATGPTAAARATYELLQGLNFSVLRTTPRPVNAAAYDFNHFYMEGERIANTSCGLHSVLRSPCLVEIRQLRVGDCFQQINERPRRDEIWAVCRVGPTTVGFTAIGGHTEFGVEPDHIVRYIPESPTEDG